ncbi:MAG: biotin--[acetyl-CoA-carboxylase] ligase [Acidobacteria bacterium]|nr:MAG: biotin--[acetyl-CoA-carboxylase] ligase [Acidobacteriota bacterium]
MGSRSGLGRRPHPERNRRVEVEDTEIGVATSNAKPSLGARLRAQGAGFGTFILHVGRCVSTNDLALLYAKHEAPHGSLFLASEQSGGRGRFKRRWESPPGGLYLSILLRPEGEFPPSLLPLLTAVSTAEAIHEICGLEVSLRWPNDLYVNERKLAGILCEGSFKGSRAEVFVVGIGINVGQPHESLSTEVRARATSISGIQGGALETEAVAACVVSRFEFWWRERDAARVLARWRELAADDGGRAVLVQPREGEGYHAVIHGLADDGGLAVEASDGTRRVLYSDDVLYLK